MDVGTLTGTLELDDRLSSQMTLVVDKLKKQFDELDGALGAIAVTAAAVTGVIVGVGASIVALGEKGSTVQGVTDAFNRLAESANTTSDALRGSFSAGLKGTVDEMTLMQSTIKLLGSGMKLTTDQANLMGEAARALGKATGTDAAGGLVMMSSALTTGRVRGLQQQIGLIDLAAGEKKFADSIGATVDQLNEVGKLEGKRIAILDATQAWLDRVGVSELSFKERLEQAKVAVENWGDELAKSVASSPHVMAALNAIGKAIQDNFGGSGQTAIETITGWVNKFADAVAEYGPPIIKVFADVTTGIGDLYRYIVDHESQIKTAMETVALFAAAWAVFSVGGKLVEGVLAGLRAMKIAMMFGAAEGAGTAGVVLGIGTVPELIIAGTLAYAVIELGKSFRQMYSDWSAGKSMWDWFGTGGKVWDNSIVGRYAANFDKRAGELATYGAVVNMPNAPGIPSGFAMPPIAAGTDAGGMVNIASGESIPGKVDNSKFLKDQADKTAAATAAGIAKAEGYWDDYYANLAKLEGDGLDAKLLGIQKWEDAQEAAILKTQKLNQAWFKDLVALDADAESKRELALAEFTQKSIESSRAIGEAALSAIDKGFAGMPDVARNLEQATAQFNTSIDESGNEIRGLIGGSTLVAHAIHGISDEGTLMGVTITQASGNSIAAFKSLASGLGEISQAFGQLASIAGGAFGAILKQIDSSIKGLDTMAKGIENIEKGQASGNTSQEIAGGISAVAGGASSVIGATSSGNTAVRTAGGAAAGAAVGAEIGLAFAPETLGLSIAIGAAAGALVGLVRGLLQVSQAEKDARVAADDWKASVVSTFDSMATASEKAEAGGVAWKKMNIEARDAYTQFGLTSDEAMRDLAMVNDASHNSVQAVATATANVTDIINAAVNVKNGVDGIVAAFASAGTHIPDDLKNTINSLIQMKGLTDDQRLALQKLVADVRPDFASLEQTAAKYGITLEGLGSQFEQGALEDAAKVVFDDFTDLTKAGGDVGGVLAGMKGSINALVNESVKFGTAIPDNLKPLIQNLIDTGNLVDANGKKFTSIGQINFEATPLSQGIQDLVTAVNNLVQTLTGQLPNAINNLPSGHVNVTVNPQLPPGFDPNDPTTWGYQPNAAGFAGGGVVYAAGGFPGKPSGTDVIPIWASPGERVLTPQQNQEYERAQRQPLQPIVQRGPTTINLHVHVPDGAIDEPQKLAPVLMDILRRDVGGFKVAIENYADMRIAAAS